MKLKSILKLSIVQRHLFPLKETLNFHALSQIAFKTPEAQNLRLLISWVNKSFSKTVKTRHIALLLSFNSSPLPKQQTNTFSHLAKHEIYAVNLMAITFMLIIFSRVKSASMLQFFYVRSLLFWQRLLKHSANFFHFR